MSDSGRVRSARRVGIALVAVLFTVSCAAGQHAQTAEVRGVIDGTQDRIGDISLDGVAIHAPSGTSYAKGSNAQLAVTLVNSSAKADTLVSVSSSAFSGWGVVPNAEASASGAPSSTQTGVTIQPGSAERLGVAADGASATNSKDTIVLTSLTTVLYPGSAVDITFRFANAGSAVLRVPVQLVPNSPGATLPGGSPSAAAG